MVALVVIVVCKLKRFGMAIDQRITAPRITPINMGMPLPLVLDNRVA